jgi:hypothetical protein
VSPHTTRRIAHGPYALQTRRRASLLIYGSLVVALGLLNVLLFAVRAAG